MAEKIEQLPSGNIHTLSLLVGLASGGTTPAAASDLTIGFGDTFSQTITAGQFVRKGDVDTFTGNAGGITKVIVSYVRETITISGAGSATVYG